MDLTLIICVYNAEKYIENTLHSIINQSTSDFHLLIIDDCSTDNSAYIVKHFFEQNPRQYELISLPTNEGIAHARQYALNIISTKYVLFIDSDDIVSPYIVSELYNKAITDSNIIAVTCWSKFIDSTGKEIAGGTFLGVKDKEEFYYKASHGKLFFMPIHTLFYRESALQAGGFNTLGFPKGKPRYQDFCEELDLWTRMSDQYIDGKYFITIPKILYYYRKSSGLSSNHFNMILKMRYTKFNVIQRRSNCQEKTFSEFFDSLSAHELKAIKKEAFAADSLRNGVMLLKKGNPIKGGYLIMRSIIARPSYFIDKIKHNI